jgi:protein-S-isoprenylcysteine O-methyltransferase Ste14
MYLGMIAILLAIAILLGSATPFLVVFPIAMLFDRVFVISEERMLIETFGERFQQYQQRVRRWI